jgi:hypothetical protein
MHEDPKALIGKRSPAFKVRDLNGQLWDTSVKNQHPYDVFFSLPGCHGCEEVIPQLQRTAGPPTFVVLAGVDTAHAHYQMRGWLQSDPHPKRPLRFVADPSMNLIERFRAYTYPSLVRVNQEGIVRSYQISMEELQAASLHEKKS